MAKKKRADEIRQLYHLADNWTRRQWERINQKGYEFAHDEQLTLAEKTNLEEQGMPTFTINRILPVVEMLNFYATANNPRWQAVGVEGSDTDVAAAMTDLMDYVWAGSNGSTLYNNAVNDCITKSIGYLMISVDSDADNGMGEVVITQPEPFDVYVDPKSRDMLFKDASYVMLRKVLPKSHLIRLFPGEKRKINSSSSDEQQQKSLSNRAMGDDEQALFHYNDPTEQTGYGITGKGEQEDLCEFFEVYEKIKVSFVNVFYRIPPTKKELAAIKEQSEVQVKEMAAEMEVQMQEQQKQMQEAVQAGKMLPDSNR